MKGYLVNDNPADKGIFPAGHAARAAIAAALATGDESNVVGALNALAARFPEAKRAKAQAIMVRTLMALAGYSEHATGDKVGWGFTKVGDALQTLEERVKKYGERAFALSESQVQMLVHEILFSFSAGEARAEARRNG